ncbi:MAG: PDZ domain-containing protein [Desulfosarcina sp.]|nr:PDZ domain-containing protein [Desulfosarcina sp.]MBC2741622.1 PDZ domain-containing protein [Desulfosarcina sp.]MBC2764536.1 PDZ domain-containing protein [Desulfosarcina sp.]
MAKKSIAHSITFLIAIVFLSMTAFFSVENVCADQHLRLELKENGFHIEARQIPLIDILKAISQQAQIILVTSDSLEEPVSIFLQSQSLEDTIERLLAKRNFAVFYNQSDDGTFSPSEIRVFGSKSPVTYLPAGTNPPGHDDHMQHYSRDWYAKEFQQAEKLSRHITAIPVKNSSAEPDPLAGGIEVKQVAENSVFSQIGLREGDLIRDVNGVPVDTTEAFLGALRVAPDQGSTIRIERLDIDNTINPIYIELR